MSRIPDNELCSFFNTYALWTNNRKIVTTDGSPIIIAEVGTIKLNPHSTITTILHVFKLYTNLRSVTKLSQDLNCRVNFFHLFENFKIRTWGGWLDVLRLKMDYISWMHMRQRFVPYTSTFDKIWIYTEGNVTPHSPPLRLCFPFCFRIPTLWCMQIGKTQICNSPPPQSNKRSNFHFHLVHTDI